MLSTQVWYLPEDNLQKMIQTCNKERKKEIMCKRKEGDYKDNIKKKIVCKAIVHQGSFCCPTLKESAIRSILFNMICRIASDTVHVMVTK